MCRILSDIFSPKLSLFSQIAYLLTWNEGTKSHQASSDMMWSACSLQMLISLLPSLKLKKNCFHYVCTSSPSFLKRKLADTSFTSDPFTVPSSSWASSMSLFLPSTYFFPLPTSEKIPGPFVHASDKPGHKWNLLMSVTILAKHSSCCWTESCITCKSPLYATCTEFKSPGISTCLSK